ncbi:sperm flagellar protein 1-like isoform 2-T2 [Mantella aurantiaca]
MNEMISGDEMQELYAWIDRLPLSRPKKNIARDFSDGVLVAEVAKHFIPKIVEIHNYIPANSTQQKLGNWATLNRKVFSKLNFHIPDDIIRKLIANTPGVIESILYTLRQKINEKLQDKNQRENNVHQESEYFSTQTRQATYGSTAVTSPTYGRIFPHIGVTDPPHGHSKRPDGYSHPYAHLESGVRLLLEEKDLEALALQETVQILQMKVQRLEHLVQLKDLRIEDLTRHLNKQRLQKNIT